MNVARRCAAGERSDDLPLRTVRDAMITIPRTSSEATTAGEARSMFRDDHVHSLLLVRAGRLVAVVQRGDLDGAIGHESAAGLGTLAERIIAPDVRLDAVHASMVSRSLRRLAVVDDQGRLLGLLCLKRSGRGFCSDEDVRARALDGLTP